LADKASTLVYNEDNLKEIADFLKQLRTVAKAIDETHKEGKAEALKIGRDWDTAKNTFKDQVLAIEEKPQREYSRICNEIQDRANKAEQERQRIANIKSGIEANSINFSRQIAECTTSQRLTDIERLINLEKTRKDKYMEFADEAIEKYTELNVLLTAQKATVKQLEEIKRQEQEAKDKQDEEAMIKLQEQREAAETKIEEAKIVVQETAINQATTSYIPVAEEIIPTVKARRTTWTWEVKDIKETAKRMPDWTTITPIESKIDEFLKAKKAEGIDGEEFIVAGIRFYVQKTF
jgi:small-conductance mechanosensitive channel